MYQHVRDYLVSMEALNSKEAKKKWRKHIKDNWNNSCAYCDKPPIDIASLTLDHVKARSKGGEDLTANVVPADRSCNLDKGSSNWKTWFRNQPFYKPWKELRINHWIEYGVVLNETQILSIYQYDPLLIK